MKRCLGLIAVLVIMVTSGQVFGFGLLSFGGSDNSGGTKVDVKALSAREATLKVRVNKATVTLARGLIEIQNACGKSTEAAKLEASLAEAQKNPSDIEQTKKLCTEVNNASASIKKVDLAASINKEDARKRLGKSLLHLGAGSLLDLQASNDAKNLVSDISNSAKSVQTSPLSYGPTAIKDLNSGLSTAKFVVETIPTQVSTIAELTKGLVKYAQTNKIEIPSQNELEQQAKNLEKE